MFIENGFSAAAAKDPQIDAPRIDPAVRQAEIDYMLNAANAALPKGVLKKLGSLSLAAASSDNDHSYFAQIRSEPIGRSGCEFRFAIPARDTGKHDLDATVAKLVSDAERFAKIAPRLRDYATMIRDTAEQTIAVATGGIARMRVVAIGVRPFCSPSAISTTIDVEMLGSDLTSGIERVTETDLERLDKKLAQLVATHLARRKGLARAMVAGASGWVDDAALRIIDAAGFDRTAILRMVRDRQEVEFSYRGGDGHNISAVLFWQDGVIEGFAERRYSDGDFRLNGRVLTIEKKGLPDTIIADLVGRRLRDVVDLRLIPESALIIDCSESDPWLYLELEIGRTTIEAAVAPS